jgi:uncharacterized protein YjeT (DUF2065 family)
VGDRQRLQAVGQNRKAGQSMDALRLVGMAIATVGLIIVLIGRLRAYPLGLYLGLIVIAVGFVIYVMDLYRVPKSSKNKL